MCATCARRGEAKRNPPRYCFKTRCLRRKTLHLQLESTRLVVMRMVCGRKMRQHPAGAPTFLWTVRTCSWLGWSSSGEEFAAKGKRDHHSPPKQLPTSTAVCSPGQRGQRGRRESTDGAVVLEDKPRIVVLVVLGLQKSIYTPARPRTPLTSRYAENCARKGGALESCIAHRIWRKVAVCVTKHASCDACRVQARRSKSSC
ncbi:hypothetical protein C8R45DRAFT_971825 [Mycena sanguinolenta]|nr:hypothetical protein C8R45DRAFT_971825 [Mycena sanguinolenta]